MIIRLTDCLKKQSTLPVFLYKKCVIEIKYDFFKSFLRFRCIYQANLDLIFFSLIKKGQCEKPIGIYFVADHTKKRSNNR